MTEKVTLEITDELGEIFGKIKFLTNEIEFINSSKTLPIDNILPVLIAQRDDQRIRLSTYIENVVNEAYCLNIQKK